MEFIAKRFLGHLCDHRSDSAQLRVAERVLGAGFGQKFAVGKAAVEFALRGRNAVMPVIVRKSSKPYRWSIGEAPLAAIANKEKKLPRNFITTEGFGITAACRKYLQPLIGGEAYPPYFNGLPAYVALKGASVPKRLRIPFVV